jgi:hypothetical protein
MVPIPPPDPGICAFVPEQKFHRLSAVFPPLHFPNSLTAHIVVAFDTATSKANAPMGTYTFTSSNLPAPITVEHEGVLVVRDDLFPGGTKARFLGILFDGAEEVVYASPGGGRRAAPGPYFKPGSDAPPVRCGPVSGKAPGLARKDRGCRECPNACLSLVPCDPWLRGLAGRVGSYRLICTYLFFDTAFYTYQKRLLLAGSSKSERKTLLRQCMKSRA